MNKTSLLARLTVAAVMSVGWIAGCTEPDAPMFPMRDFQQGENSRASENVMRAMEPLHDRPLETQLPSANQARNTSSIPYRTPTTLPYPTTQQACRRLTLQQCIHLAAANSLDVRVAAYQPGIDEARVVEALANFDPKFFWQVQFQHTDVIQPSTSDPTAANPLGAPLRFSLLQSTSGIKQDTPTGAEIELSYNVEYTDRLIPTILASPGVVNPFFNDELMLKVTQPVLQNFGAEANFARMKIARNTQGQSLMDFKLALEKQMADIEEAYWQLVEAERVLAIRHELVQRAKDTESLIKARMGIDATDIDVSQADAAVAQREADLPTAQADIEQLSDKLKALINDPDMPVSSSVLLLPADQPSEEAIDIDPTEALKTAMDCRADLAQERLKIDSARVTQQAAKNNELPTLNLIGQFGVEGDGANSGQMFTNTSTGNLLDYSVGFELDIPIGFREAKAIFRRTQLARYQEICKYQLLEEKAAQEVKDQLSLIRALWQRIELTRQSRLKSQKTLSLLEDRIQSRAIQMAPAITQTRLQYQSDLADSENKEIDAITQYNIAISKLEQAKGTLLRYNNVSMEEESPNWKPAFESRP